LLRKRLARFLGIIPIVRINCSLAILQPTYSLGGTRGVCIGVSNLPRDTIAARRNRLIKRVCVDGRNHRRLRSAMQSIVLHNKRLMGTLVRAPRMPKSARMIKERFAQ
jgi:hypothetical protein